MNGKFNFIQTSRRLRFLFSSKKLEYQSRKSIPSAKSMTYNDGHYADCFVVCVDIRDSSTLHAKYANDDLLVKIYQGFISETVRLFNQCPYIAHVDIHGDAVTGIFHAKRLGASASVILEWAVRASEIVTILNAKLAEIGIEPIRVGVGLSHGKVLMVKAGARGAESDVVWLGEPVNYASKLSSYANKQPSNGDGQFMATPSFYNGLLDEYKKWFSYHQGRECYTTTAPLSSADYRAYEKEWPLLEKRSASPAVSFLTTPTSRPSTGTAFLSNPSALASLARPPIPVTVTGATPMGLSLARLLADTLDKKNDSPTYLGGLPWLEGLNKK